MSDRLQEIKNRAEKATPGPWEPQEPWGTCGNSWGRVKGPKSTRQYYGSMCFDKMDDVEFIAHSRDDVPYLLSKVEAAEKLAQAAEKLLATTTPQDCTHGEEASYCLSCEFEAEKALEEAIDPVREALAAYRKTT
jgi:hypothetical protein